MPSGTVSVIDHDRMPAASGDRAHLARQTPRIPRLSFSSPTVELAEGGGLAARAPRKNENSVRPGKSVIFLEACRAFATARARKLNFPDLTPVPRNRLFAARYVTYDSTLTPRSLI